VATHPTNITVDPEAWIERKGPTNHGVVFEAYRLRARGANQPYTIDPGTVERAAAKPTEQYLLELA
jgi:hypothetical protein